MIQKVQIMMQTFIERGGWWVTAQFGLLFALVVAPPELPGLPVLSMILGRWVPVAGLCCVDVAQCWQAPGCSILAQI
jgi:hypothetical protein